VALEAAAVVACLSLLTSTCRLPLIVSSSARVDRGRVAPQTADFPVEPLGLVLLSLPAAVAVVVVPVLLVMLPAIMEVLAAAAAVRPLESLELGVRASPLLVMMEGMDSDRQPVRKDAAGVAVVLVLLALTLLQTFQVTAVTA